MTTPAMDGAQPALDGENLSMNSLRALALANRR